jgi:hypothetical protein
MTPFWRNPELIRHARADLRPARIVGIASLALLACALIALGTWSSVANMQFGRAQSFGETLYAIVASLQFGVLCLWSFFACLQAVARERESKTFDFQRTTSLSAGELMMGKLLGTPIVAWFIFACLLPAAILGATLANFSFRQVVSTYLLLIIFVLFLGLGGLWMSMWMERQRSGSAVIGVLFMLYLAALAQTPFMSTTVPGFFGFSPFLAIHEIYNSGNDIFFRGRATIFGYEVEWVWISMFLYLSFGAWLVLMIRRNLKRDLSDVRLLSPLQAVGSAIFVNALLYAFMHRPVPIKWEGRQFGGVDGRYEFAIAVNIVLLYWIGIVALPSYERLKVWARTRKSYVSSLFAEDGLVWPWVLVTALIGMACLAAYAGSGHLSQQDWTLARAMVMLIAILILACRDMLFLQWCTLTRMKPPAVKGVMLLIVYYVSAAVIIGSAFAFSPTAGERAFAFLTPFASFETAVADPYFIAGEVLQLAIVVLLLRGINARLRRAAAIHSTQAA